MAGRRLLAFPDEANVNEYPGAPSASALAGTTPAPKDAMHKRITGYHLDEERHWVAQLECGHNQHVRHNPPFHERPWTQTPGGRDGMLGQMLNCVKCDRDEPADRRPRS